MILPEKTWTKDKLKIAVYSEQKTMAKAASEFVASELNKAIASKGHANLIIGTGASQFSFFNAFLKEHLNWEKINLFHLDEYIGIPEKHPASFRRYLIDRVLDKVIPNHVFFLNGDAADTGLEMNRYSELLKQYPTDVACIGIGENGHIAFNDPPVADFSDPQWVKIVELDEACKNQQVGEGWFTTADEVPRLALTLTIPAIMQSKVISCVVPDKRKSGAVFHALNGEITTKCPASILREHGQARLFLDKESASLLME